MVERLLYAICFSVDCVNFRMMRTNGRRLKRSREANFLSNMVSEIDSQPRNPHNTGAGLTMEKKVSERLQPRVFHMPTWSQSSFHRLHQEDC